MFAFVSNAVAGVPEPATGATLGPGSARRVTYPGRAVGIVGSVPLLGCT